MSIPHDGDSQVSGPQQDHWGAGDVRLQLVVESCPSGLVMVDSRGVIVLVNSETESLFGYDRSELLGQRIEILVPERFRGAHPGHRAGFTANPETRKMGEGRELFGRRKDGSEFPVEIALNPISAPDGEFVLAVVVDITSRKMEEEKFRLAVESCPSGMAMVDAEGRILLVNAETERLFGYDRSELIGQSIDMLVPRRFRDQHPQHRQGFNQCPAKRSMGVGRDLFGLRKNGQEFPVEIGLNPIATREGTLTLSVIVDISERRRAEAELAAHAEELRRSNSDLEQFAYVASHDLQEPLRMVASYTALLAERYSGQLDEKADKYIGYAVEGAKRMQRLVNDLLAYSRVGTQAKKPEPVDASAALRSSMVNLRTALEACGGEVLADPLPRVMVDPMQLGQVFQNLLSNAIKFRSERPLRVRVSAIRMGNVWNFTFADNGIGIDERHWGKVFEVFQRLHERGRFEGNGIGLAIVKKVIERQGGRVWIESTVGEGTRFHFSLPAIKEPEVES